MKKFCPNCGNPVEKDDKFCIRCGQSLDNSTELLKKENPVKPSKKSKLVYWLIVKSDIIIRSPLIVSG